MDCRQPTGRAWWAAASGPAASSAVVESMRERGGSVTESVRARGGLEIGEVASREEGHAILENYT